MNRQARDFRLLCMREMSDSHDGLFLNAPRELNRKGYLAPAHQFTAVDLR